MKPVRVLVADDNEDHLYFIERALNQIEGDLQIDTVQDGVEVMDYLNRRGTYEAKERPHLILLDLRMPRRDGIEVLEELKADPVLRTIPVCVLTSSDRPEDIAAAYARGGNSYVVKPSDLKGILEELQIVGDYWAKTATLPEPPNGPN
jgi:CheY-like chemotaxis protein